MPQMGIYDIYQLEDGIIKNGVSGCKDIFLITDS